jgi:hypothetical protein
MNANIFIQDSFTFHVENDSPSFFSTSIAIKVNSQHHAASLQSWIKSKSLLTLQSYSFLGE